jgi:hypothetical protein
MGIVQTFVHPGIVTAASISPPNPASSARELAFSTILRAKF